MAYSERPVVERRSGIQTTPTDDDQEDERPRDPLAHGRAVDEGLEPQRPRHRPGEFEHEQRAARPDERHRQRHDDVRHPGHHDEGPVDRPQHEAQQEDADDDDDRELLGLALHQGRRDDAGEGHHRADRQVDPARDDDDRLSDGGEGQGQGPDGEVLELRRRRIDGWMACVNTRKHDEQHEQADRSSRCAGRSAGDGQSVARAGRGRAAGPRSTGRSRAGVSSRRLDSATTSAATSSGIGASGGRS